MQIRSVQIHKDRAGKKKSLECNIRGLIIEPEFQYLPLLFVPIVYDLITDLSPLQMGRCRR